MGMCDYADVKDYWSPGRRRNDLVCDLFPSYHRFFQIGRAMRCMDFAFGQDDEAWRAASLEHGAFAKTDAFARMLSDSFQQAYDLEQFISADEQSVPTKCRHPARQFNKEKPWHFFLKIFALNSSVTGYLWKFYFYRGKDEERPAAFNKPGLVTAYPIHVLTEDSALHHKGHILAMDNWYTSHAAADILLGRGIHFCGTVLTNRLGFRQTVTRMRRAPKGSADRAPRATPTTITTVIDPGEKSQMNPPAARGICAQAVLSDFPGKLSKDLRTLYCTGWLDSKPVHLLASMKSPLTTCSRRLARSANSVQLQQPAIIALYNKVMGGTDLNDQMLRYYSRMSKGKWTIKVFQHLFYAAAYNAFVCFTQLKPQGDTTGRYRLKQFLENVVAEMHSSRMLYLRRQDAAASPGTGKCKKQHPKPRACTIMQQPGRASAWAVEHHLERHPDAVCKDCVVCRQQGKRFRVVTRCCNSSLCFNRHVCVDHFVAFHNTDLAAQVDDSD